MVDRVVGAAENGECDDALGFHFGLVDLDAVVDFGLDLHGLRCGRRVCLVDFCCVLCCVVVVSM